MSNHKAIVIRTDSLIDGMSDIPIKDGGILIENNKITRVASWEDGSPWPAGEDILQLKSRAVIPGLINIHVHITGEEDLSDYIESGVTTVRDVGTDPFGSGNMLLTGVKDEIDKGNLKGPRIFSYGSIIDGPKTIFPTLAVSISSVDAIIAEVDRQVANGVDGIKLYSKITPRLATAAIKRAREHDKPVAGHIGILISGVGGGRLGINTIEHVISFLRDLFPPFVRPVFTLMSKAGLMDNPTKGLDKFFDMWRKIDIEDKSIKRIAEDFQATGAAFHPTIVALERITKIGELMKTKNPKFDKMSSIETIKEIYAKTLPEKWNDRLTQLGKECLDGMLRFVYLMYKTGVPIGVGTDDSIPYVFPGESMPEEMEFFTRAGIPAMDVIKMSTSQNAKTLRRDDLGIISEGKTADVVLLNGDPLTDINAVKDIAYVVKEGKVVSAK